MKKSYSNSKTKYYQLLTYCLGVCFIFLSGCKTKQIESKESNKNIATTNDSVPKPKIINSDTIWQIEAIYGVKRIIYIEQESGTPFNDE